ncbi:TRAP transporter small permease [Marinobacterium lutimaris]|uniref:TRAP transporter small permease protein n=1 Tax=Marinobacterium lutimaris TaxID=568106 RepID=A0A1H6DUS3_9GAMM|nr:TRAP transporter small permease [Marinobacterium lutimaris]SEG89041.1 TRAP-type C4-dicarboxylate transport system, small permease component [Marinobacterium lutimaris]
MNSAHLPKVAAKKGVTTRVVEWVDASIVVASTVAAIGSLAIMFISLMAEVIVRYLTNQGMGWPTEMPNILFPWLVMGGIVLGAQRGQHIAVTALNVLLGRTGNRVLMLSHQVLITATFFYLAWVGLGVIEITGSEMYPVTGITARWAYLAMIVGFVGLGITAITTFARLLLADNPHSVRKHHIEEDV